MSVHHLKIHRKPFEDLVSGRKTGEVRNCADREFREGDQVELFLIDETGNPANKSIVRTITHIQRGYGLPDDICVLSYAAPVVERQEPIGFVTRRDGKYGSWLHSSQRQAENFDSTAINGRPGNSEILAVYTSPPAPVAVIKPVVWRIPVNGDWFYGTKEQCEREYAEYTADFTAEDFDEAGPTSPEPLAYLDKVKELNQ